MSVPRLIESTVVAAASVKVVELRFRDRVVHIDRREQQRILRHLVEPLHTCGGLFGDTLDELRHARPLCWVRLQRALQQPKDDREFCVVGLGRVRHLPGCFILDTLVKQQRCVAAIVEDHVGPVVTLPGHHLLGAPPIFLKGLTFPSKDRHALRIVFGAVRPHDHRPLRGLGWKKCCMRPIELPHPTPSTSQ